jgi:hypothetical protein
MSRWFRFYGDAMRNPKVIGLNDRDFRTWVGLLAIASEHNGRIPPATTVKTLLSMRLDHLLSALQRLVKAGLIDELADCYEPHNWAKFQYKSDTSTDRVTLHRKRKVTVGETPPETEPETEGSLAKANAGKTDSDQQFWDSAKSYLSSESRNPGALVGKWVRDHGKVDTAAAITRAQLERPVQRIPFIEGCFRQRTREMADGPVC